MIFTILQSPTINIARNVSECPRVTQVRMGTQPKGDVLSEPRVSAFHYDRWV